MKENTPPVIHLARLAIILLVGTSLFVLVLGALAFGYRASYQEEIYPGIRIAWVDLSGLSVAEATTLLSKELDYSQVGKLLLRDGERSWLTSPGQVGLILGADHNARRAYQIGRQGNLSERLQTVFEAWYSGTNLTPEMFFDEQTARRYLTALAEEIDTPTIEASLSIAGTDVVVKPGQIGRSLDIAANTALLQKQTQSLLDGEIELVVNEDPPAILDVSVQAEIARTILSAPLVLSLPGAGADDPGPWTIPPENLANMLVIERVESEQGDTYQVGLSSELLREYLNQIAPGLYREWANARFIFNDDTRQLEVIQPSVTGQYLDIESSVQLINEAVIRGEHQVSLDMEYTLPEVGDEATAASLGITELVHNEVSYFRGSSPERVQNIITAAARFHGVLVAPGETFSMAAVLGDVSLDTGYAEAWIIYGDRTIKGVGGGVCQVSTTLFRTVFFSGLEINERHPHAYRVTYYEQVYGGINPEYAGLDATVYVPVVDFKFTNDTPYWLLMETYVGRDWLQWKFYSTSDGRSVNWTTTGLINVQEPPAPVYQENSDLNEGQVKQVDWAVAGADVSVTRTVNRDGQVILQDVFNTSYIPWRAVCEYGPGTPGMPPSDPDKNNPCRPDPQ